MGQAESVNKQPPKEKSSKVIIGDQLNKNQDFVTDTAGSSNLKENGIKSQNQMLEQLTNSRLQLKIQREQEIKKVSESKEKDVVSKLLRIIEQNQEQLVEILDERVQLINQNLEDKLLVLENKLDEVNDKLKGFESVLYEEFRQQNVREELDSLRIEVKQMVALSEKYIKDESKIQEIQNLSKLHKSIQKENKPTKKELNPACNKLSLMRERSKIQKHMSDSQILKDFDENMGYSFENNNYHQQSGYSMLNVSQFFNQNNNNNNNYNSDYSHVQFQTKIE